MAPVTDDLSKLSPETEDAINKAIARNIAKISLQKYRECAFNLAVRLDDRVTDAGIIGHVIETQCEERLDGITWDIPSSLHEELLKTAKTKVFTEITYVILLNRSKDQVRKRAPVDRNPPPKITD